MLNQIDIRKESTRIAKEFNLDENEVHKIIMYEFNFIKQVMQDPEEYKDVMLHDLFRFTLKPHYKTCKHYTYDKDTELQQNPDNSRH